MRQSEANPQLQFLPETAPPARRYASGVDAPAIFRGYAKAGVPICMAMDSASAPSVERLIEYVNNGGIALVDSGAFEARSKPSDLRWNRVFTRYAMIAKSTRGQAVEFVLPDVVGNQDMTLRLLHRLRNRIERVRAWGGRFLLPVQRGQLTPSIFWKRATTVLGFTPNGIAIPSAKAAFTPSDLTQLLCADDLPGRIHFLGIGRRRAALAERVERVRAKHPNAEITADACEHRSQARAGGAYSILRQRYLEKRVSDYMAGEYDDTEDTSFDDLLLEQAASIAGVMLPPGGYSQLEDESPEAAERLFDVYCQIAPIEQNRHARLAAKEHFGPEATEHGIAQFAKDSFEP